MSYRLITRDTEQDWHDVAKHNPIAEAIRTAKETVRDVLLGTASIGLIGGDPGVGKTHLITEVINEVRKRKPHLKVFRSRPSNYQQLADAFIQTQEDGVIVLEECTHIFRNRNCLDLLKQVTDPELGKQFTITLPPLSKKEGYRHVTVKWRPIIMAYNGSSEAILKDKLFGPHIAAVFDRETPFDIEAEPEPMWEYTMYLALCHGLIRRTVGGAKPIPIKVQNDAVKWFSDHAWRQKSLSPRQLIKIAALFLADYERLLLAKAGKDTYDHTVLQAQLRRLLLPNKGTNERLTTAKPHLPPPAPEIFYKPRHLLTRAEQRVADAYQGAVAAEPDVAPESELNPPPTPAPVNRDASGTTLDQRMMQRISIQRGAPCTVEPETGSALREPEPAPTPVMESHVPTPMPAAAEPAA